MNKLLETPDEPFDASVSFNDVDAITFIVFKSVNFYVWAKTRDAYHGDMTECFDILLRKRSGIFGKYYTMADMLSELFIDKKIKFHGDLSAAIDHFRKVGESQSKDIYGRVWVKSNIFSIWASNRSVINNIKYIVDCFRYMGIDNMHSLVWDFDTFSRDGRDVVKNASSGSITLGDILKKFSNIESSGSDVVVSKDITDRLNMLRMKLHTSVPGVEKDKIKGEIRKILNVLYGDDYVEDKFTKAASYGSGRLAGTDLFIAENFRNIVYDLYSIEVPKKSIIKKPVKSFKTYMENKNLI